MPRPNSDQARANSAMTHVLSLSAKVKKILSDWLLGASTQVIKETDPALGILRCIFTFVRFTPPFPDSP